MKKRTKVRTLGQKMKKNNKNKGKKLTKSKKKAGDTYSKPRFGIGTWVCFPKAGQKKKRKTKK